MKPPKDIKPDVLFRLLIRRPRPFMKIDHKIYMLEKFELWAHALTSEEIHRADDDGGVHEVAARSIHCDGELAFGSGEEIGSLESNECRFLMEAFGKSFQTICPALIATDAEPWKAALYEGAKSPSNFSVVIAMSECCDVAVGSTLVRTPRSDRYYGVPLCDLTDGQRMAFSAANKLINEQIETDSQE